MNYQEMLPGEYLYEFEELSAAKGKTEEKVKWFRKAALLEPLRKQPDHLYQLWLRLFKEDPLPVAWLQGESHRSASNLGALMKELKLSSYNELHQWSVGQRAAFWEQAIDRLGIKFQKKYSRVLDLPRGVEDPVWLEGAEMNITDSCFTASPSEIAIIQGSEAGPVKRITYGELSRLADRIASGLVRLGLQPGDSIVIYMPLTIESVAAYLAIVKAGMSVVSVADSFSAAELKKRISITGAKAVFTCDSYVYGGKTLDVFSRVKEAESPLAVICNDGGLAVPRNETGDVLFEDLLQDKSFPAFITAPDAVTNVLFSSGTTKEPKAIPWTHLTPLKCAADGYFHLNIKQEDVVTWTTGMGWMMAPWLIYASLINRATMAIYTGAATGERFGSFVSEEGITVLGTIPSVVKAWKMQRLHEKFHWEKVKVFSSTGEPSNQEDYFYLMALAGFRAPVIEYCGGTEIGGGYITGSVLQPASPATFTTPAMGLDFYLLGQDQKPVPVGKTGEVYIVPPSIGLTQRLLNKDHHEEYYKGVPPGPGGEVLRRHGDAFDTVKVMDTVFYKSTGRVDDAMNLGGIKVSAVEIEEVLNRHPAILETAAISVPGDGGGPERLIVFYHPRNSTADTEGLKKELQSLLTKELNPLFRISEIAEKKALPRTASNKLMRRELRKEYMTGR